MAEIYYYSCQSEQTGVKLSRLVDEARQELAPETAGRAIDWHIGPLPEVQGDPVLLRSVVANLLSNTIMNLT